MKSKLTLGFGLFAGFCVLVVAWNLPRDSDFHKAADVDFHSREISTQIPTKTLPEATASAVSATPSTSAKISAANRRYASVDRNPLDFKNRILQSRKRRADLLGTPDPAQLAAGSLRQGGNYGFLPGVWALPEKRVVANDERRIVERSVGYAFLRAAPDEVIPEGALPVAMNQSSQSIGVATGVVSVKFVNPVSAQAVASEFGLKLVQTFEPLQIAMYQSSRLDPTELTTLLSALRKDDRVQRANLEILDRMRVPK